MTHIQQLITDHLDLWTSAETEKKSGRGRSSGNGDTVYGIKKLRELILELAVRGKLVPQDPNDEPASELLKRIQAERAKLEKKGRIRKSKQLPLIPCESKKFELPLGWEFVRLSDLGGFVGGKTPSTNRHDYWDGKIPWITPKDMKSIDVSDSEDHVTKAAIDDGLGMVPERSVLVVVRSGILRRMVPVAINLRPCTVNQDLKALCLVSNDMAEYVRLMIQGFERFILLNLTKVGTTVESIKFEEFERQPFPLPPLAEQHRIVAKVDEMMALCDQLETQHNNATDAHEKLVTHLLGTLTQSQNADDFAANWQRIAEHFDTLFTTEHSIDTLKQTLLQLAVMGKLVPQDPNDEPASELLKRIQAEKAKLIAAGKIKKEKPLPPISDEEQPFELPTGWEWDRLESLANLITKGSSPKWQGVSYTDNPEDVLFVTSENVGKYRLLLDEPKYVEAKFNEIEPRSILMRGDFLMNIVGASIGRTAIFDRDLVANINQAVCLIRISCESPFDQYLLHFFNSETCLSYMYDKQVDNARPNLSMGNIAKFVIPVPPVSEQQKIVKKLEELTLLCDELKSRITEYSQLKQKLADALVTQALTA